MPIGYKKIALGVILFNLFILSLYLTFLDIASSPLRTLLFSIILVDVVGIVTLRRPSKINDRFQNINFSLFVIIIFLCFIESMRFFPGLIPLQIRNYLKDNSARGPRERVIEYFNQEPFGKFKPNVTVYSQRYRGTDKQFVYQWQTDKLGFKNKKEILEEGRIEIVAVGDSFTEGMGVSIEDTWPSILTKHGFVTYNLGVQGYSPTQCEAIFRMYGYNLKPKYVIIGYTAGTYVRQSYHGLNGGIVSIAVAERIGIRKQSRSLITAVFLWLRGSYLYPLRLRLHNLSNVIAYRNSGARKNNPVFKKYTLEVLEAQNKKIDSANLTSSPEYKEALNAFLNIKKMADEIGAKLFFVYLPSRGYMYYEKATGRKLPEDSFELVEARLLKQFCEKERIVYIDPFNRLNNYIKNLGGNNDFSIYPYLEIDSHMSRYGYELIAEEIIGCLLSFNKSRPIIN